KRRILADIFLHPIQVALRDVENEFWFLESMWLARVNDHLRGYATRLERVVILVALRRRHARVRLAVDDERRRGHLVHVRDRRVFAEALEMLPGLAAEIIRQKPRDIGRAVEAPQIGHALADRRGLEALCLANGPR